MVNIKFLFICLLSFIPLVFAASKVTGYAELPGKTVEEAQSNVYRIHPAYCSCKTICNAGCYAKSACNNCKQAVKSICPLLLDKPDDVQVCYNQAEKDLGSNVAINSSGTQRVPLQFSAGKFNGTYAYRIASHLNAQYPDFFDCKKACNNLDGKSSNKSVCTQCNLSLCAFSGPCRLTFSDSDKCRIACNADLQFYDDLSRKGTCGAVVCNPVHVQMTA